MSEFNPEERSWQPDEGEAAITELKQGIRRVKEHFEVFRAATAPDQSVDEPDAV